MFVIIENAEDYGYPKGSKGPFRVYQKVECEGVFWYLIKHPIYSNAEDYQAGKTIKDIVLYEDPSFDHGHGYKWARGEKGLSEIDLAQEANEDLAKILLTEDKELPSPIL